MKVSAFTGQAAAAAMAATATIFFQLRMVHSRSNDCCRGDYNGRAGGGEPDRRAFGGNGGGNALSAREACRLIRFPPKTRA